MQIELLPEQPVEGRALGRHLHHDDRSRDFPAYEIVLGMAYAGDVEPRPRHRSWYRRTVWDQNTPAPWNGYRAESSCTTQAVGGVLVTSPFTAQLNREQKLKLYDPSFRYNAYRLAQEHDPWPGSEPQYYGSSGVAACKALQVLGIVPEGWKYRWAFGGDEAHAILPYTSLSVGTWWYEGFDRPDRNGRVKKTGQKRGGHQWQILDYAEDEDAYVGLNSWGRRWGRNGRFLVDRREFYELLEEDGDVVIWSPA